MTKSSIIQEPTWSDRNSLGLNRTGEVRALKPKLLQVIDTVRGCLNEHIDVPRSKIYNPGVNIRDIMELVPLEYKDEYTAQKKKNILDFLENLSLSRRVESKKDHNSRTDEVGIPESWQSYFQRLSINPMFMDLRDYHNLTRIDKEDGRRKRIISDEEMLATIERSLIRKSVAIVKLLIDKDPPKLKVSHDLTETHQEILAWALINKLFEPEIIDQIDFGDMPADVLVEKYKGNVEYDIFDAIMEELKP